VGGGLHGPHGGRIELKTELKAVKTNPLIGRREVDFEINEPSTPSRSAVRRDIAVLMKAELDQVWVRKIMTKTGTQTTVGVAHVYDDLGQATKFEPAYIIERNKAPEQPSEEQTPEEQPAEEEQVEEEQAETEEEQADAAEE
jgi:ribosomal protein S24E